MKLARSIPVLYIHGDNDEQFSGFEVNSPNFATTPHGNWVTWGYLNACHVQRADKTAWGVQLSWQGCRDHVFPLPTLSPASDMSGWEVRVQPGNRPQVLPSPLNFTHMAWQFFANLHSNKTFRRNFDHAVDTQRRANMPMISLNLHPPAAIEYLKFNPLAGPIVSTGHTP